MISDSFVENLTSLFAWYFWAPINTFLPKQLSDQETKKICEETIKSLGASSMKDMGKVMGILKSKYSDSIDFSKVSSIIKGLLSWAWNIQKNI